MRSRLLSSELTGETPRYRHTTFLCIPKPPYRVCTMLHVVQCALFAFCSDRSEFPF